MSDRFLLKKLDREFLLRIDERLVPLGFQRVHRSAIVNLDRVAEIVAFDTGDGEAKLHTDATVPVSRRFRQELRERLS